MNKAYKFSILIANYNNKQYLKDCIESVLAQTYLNWEIIFVDDYSNDESIEVMSNYTNDSRIKIFKNNKNTGCGATKKKCAELASGDVLCELDPDDAIAPSTLEEINKIYKNNYKVGFVYTNYYECDKNLNPLRVSTWPKKLYKNDSNLLSPKSSPLRTFKRSAYQKTSGYNPYFKKAVDKDIVYKIEEVTDSIFLNMPLYYYRIHNNNISLGKNIFLANVWDIKAKYEAYKRRQFNGFPNLSDEKMSAYFWAAFFLSLVIFNLKNAKHFSKQALETKKSLSSFLESIFIFLRVLKYFFTNKSL